jgi:hypothetical protein
VVVPSVGEVPDGFCNLGRQGAAACRAHWKKPIVPGWRRTVLRGVSPGADHLRHLPVPRILHHCQPGHRRRRQNPPRACHHRAGQRGPERQRLGSSAFRCIHCQCGLAGLGRHGVQPHPISSGRRWKRAGESPDGTIRRKLISVPARMASSARKVRLHLPADWPWETAWTALFTRAFPRPAKT